MTNCHIKQGICIRIRLNVTCVSLSDFDDAKRTSMTYYQRGMRSIAKKKKKKKKERKKKKKKKIARTELFEESFLSKLRSSYWQFVLENKFIENIMWNNHHLLSKKCRTRKLSLRYLCSCIKVYIKKKKKKKKKKKNRHHVNSLIISDIRWTFLLSGDLHLLELLINATYLCLFIKTSEIFKESLLFI